MISWAWNVRVFGPPGQRGADRQWKQGRQADSEPEPGKHVPSIGFDQACDQNPHDEGRLEALTEGDQQVCEEHRISMTP